MHEHHRFGRPHPGVLSPEGIDFGKRTTPPVTENKTHISAHRVVTEHFEATRSGDGAVWQAIHRGAFWGSMQLGADIVPSEVAKILEMLADLILRAEARGRMQAQDTMRAALGLL